MPTNSEATTDAEAALLEFLSGTSLGDPTQRNIAISQKDGTVTFSFNWLAGEDTTFVKDTEASINFAIGTGETTISLTCSIQGQGTDKETRLTNARAQVPTDSEALTLALDLLGSLFPVGLELDPDPATKGTSINENQGSITANWTFRTIDTEFGGFRIEVTTTFPSDVFVEIPIPGRTEGPIQQKMNTITSQIISVSLTSENNTVKPDNTTIIAEMDSAGGIQAIDFLQNDQETFDVNTKNYRRQRTHFVRKTGG